MVIVSALAPNLLNMILWHRRKTFLCVNTWPISVADYQVWNRIGGQFQWFWGWLWCCLCSYENIPSPLNFCKIRYQQIIMGMAETKCYHMETNTDLNIILLNKYQISRFFFNCLMTLLIWVLQWYFVLNSIESNV